jgi:branched-subunit amino acid aminotransferase/4-amino-4-deoxychorismate lyase
MYNADVVFTTGTMGELTPVKSIDGRIIENRKSVGLFDTFVSAFKEKTIHEGEPIDNQ